MQNATIDRRSSPKAATGRNRHRAFALFALLPFLAVSCSDEPQASKTAAAAARPQVSVTVLHPQNVAVTAELPGRTAASLVAEVRPQVTGIIRARNFREGSEVKEGDVLYEIDPATYQAAYDTEVAAVQKAEGAIPSAQSKVDRYKSLAQQNAVSAQDYDDAMSTLAQAQADLASARAALETARINLDYTKIRAPIGGRIDESSVTVGALVQAAQTTALATINSLDPINVDVTQSSTNLLKFRRGVEEGRLKMSGDNVAVRLILEDGSTYGQNGTLEFTSATVDKTVGTFTVRATFSNPDRLLLPGMYVRAIIEEGVAQNSFLVPQRAVTRNAKGEATAMFVDANGKVAQRVLPVQQSVGNSWLVSDDIADGDRVVVEGLQQIKDGQDVTATEVILDDATGMIRQSDAGTANPADQAALSPDRK